MKSVDGIDILGVKAAIEEELNSFLASSPSLEKLKRLPIKNTGIPAKIAQTLGLPVKKYKQTVLRQMEINSPEGQRIRTAILAEMPVLP